MDVGDLICYRHERGVVVHVTESCTIMRTVAYHSYVPVLNVDECTLVTKAFLSPQECTIKPELVQRIECYVDAIVETPTGGDYAC